MKSSWHFLLARTFYCTSHLDPQWTHKKTPGWGPGENTAYLLVGMPRFELGTP